MLSSPLYEQGGDAETGYDALSPSRIKGKGGLRATSFIYGLVALENMGFVANMVSLVLFFSYKMYFDLSNAANTLTNLMGSTFLLTIVGGFISDTFINRFQTCVIFGTFEVLVIAVAVRNRGLSLPESPSELYEINEKDSVSTAARIAHTEQFRCLDKAAILPPNTEPAPWKVCTVTQGYRMDPHLGSFRVPSASIPVIPLLFMIVLIPIYDRLFVPFVRKFSKHPSGVTQLQRVGVGLVLSALSMSIAALVEVKRRNQSLKNPLRPISLFWLAFQYGIFGIADMFTLVGLLEFFYKEAPEGMKSLSTSFTWISLSFGYFLSSVFVDSINSVTKRIAPSRQGWLHGQDLDRNNLNLFYWFLAILSGLNFFNYLYWATWYKYKNNDENIAVRPATGPQESVSDVPFLKVEEDMSCKAANGGCVVEESNGRD
ncbi:UNVERIFIED_CONTAM: protein NRT1/ PTR FAMILY 4.6 [Sesamum radiatum]|uniref:Protein NRT1/ PTR FAMILY 4.6 n=1 Tax=Sesamum radiatum TaxID=300843 RepID=A0AAW2U8H2_SESRA